jgi:hypothetical protein
MKRIDLVNKIDQEYGLMNLFKSGIVQWTELRDRDIYLQYDAYIKMGQGSMDAKQNTGEGFKVDIRTVERAIKKMNEEICNTFAGTKGKA